MTSDQDRRSPRPQRADREISIPHRARGASRRDLLGFAATTALLCAMGLRTAHAQPAGRFFLTQAEETILRAAVDRILPRDEWPSASEAGVVDFLDFQLATSWGQGRGLFRQGPHEEGEETQGYQLPHTPAELYREALAAFAQEPSLANFTSAGPEQQDDMLRRIEKGEVRLGSVPGQAFFRMLRQNTLEGYLSDPIHNGNRDLAGWRMLGFPGAHAYYLSEVDRFDMEYRRAPSGVAARGGREPVPFLRRPAAARATDDAARQGVQGGRP